jgi:hypothetical protein
MSSNKFTRELPIPLKHFLELPDKRAKGQPFCNTSENFLLSGINYSAMSISILKLLLNIALDCKSVKGYRLYIRMG